MASRILFITGTDTGVGKTVFAVLVTQHLRGRGFCVAALKPVCSGNREDARLLREAAGKALPLDEVNPWHFRAPLAPALAARREKQRVRLRAVTAHIRDAAKRFDLVVVEGAGGLLSPLGEDFDSRDLIKALGATPIIVCPNKLGAVNQVRLTLGALPRVAARKAGIVLANPARLNAASRTNLKLLKEFVDPNRLRVLPWLGGKRR
jgi:dethiobiotin synthetase